MNDNVVQLPTRPRRYSIGAIVGGATCTLCNQSVKILRMADGSQQYVQSHVLMVAIPIPNVHTRHSRSPEQLLPTAQWVPSAALVRHEDVCMGRVTQGIVPPLLQPPDVATPPPPPTPPVDGSAG